MTGRYIAVAGNIGVGKSTLVEYIAATYGLEPVYEPFADNPFLTDFYEDMSRWAYQSQTWFLAHKFRLHKMLESSGKPLVQDRTIFEDAEIFARHLYESGHMPDRDWHTYRALYDAMCLDLRPPDLLIYLTCDVRNIKKRIKKRGREAEQSIPTRYISKLNKRYDAWIADWNRSPVLRWNTARQDYLSDLVHRIDFQNAIERHLSQAS